MRINHNISALNGWRSINSTNTDMGKTLERLSSGLRINRAGDDAAGLAISEKMRGQIKGLEMAIKNSEDAISLIQTAEGALTEVHSILQRMRELAVQASSDTNTNVDRNQIQAELDQLRQEIDRIARTTEFNTMKLLDGKIEAFRPQANVKVVTGGNFNLQAVNSGDISYTIGSGITLANYTGNIGAGTTTTINLAINHSTLGTINLGNVRIETTNTVAKIYIGDIGGTPKTTVTVADDTSQLVTTTIGDLGISFVLTDTDTTAGSSVSIRVTNLQITLATTKTLTGTVTFNDAREGSYVVEVGQFQGAATSALDVRINHFNETGLASSPIVDFAAGAAIFGSQPTATGSLESTGSITFATLNIQGDKGILFKWNTSVYSINSFDGAALPLEEVVDSGVVRAEERWYQDTSLVFQIGANEGHNMLAGLDDMRAAALGLTEQTLKVTDQNSAERTIMVVDAAIHKVSSARAALGAIQNRLEHTIANLGVAAENLTAAESRIRDADMAKEMMQYTKQLILLQSSMSMLAQANAQPQNVLQLLR